jgi:hypothetical protein
MNRKRESLQKWEEWLARARQEVAAIACARQEAADAHASQEAAAARDPPGRASQDKDDKYDEYKDEYDDEIDDKKDEDDNDEYEDKYDEYEDEYDDEIDDDDDDDDDAKDEYKDIAGQFFARVDATMAKIQAMDDGFENWAAAREKALADEANKRERAAAQENALADKLRQADVLEKTLADEATKRRRADTLKKALADEAKERHEAAVQAKVLAAKVLADKRGGQESAARGNPLKTVRQRARPCVRVGLCHGPRASNTQEYLLCGRRHRPQAPNQSTVSGWA